VLQLVQGERDAARFARIAGSGLFEPAALALLGPEAVAARLGEPAPAALDQAEALVIEPAAVMEAWTGETLRATVAAIRREGDAWSLVDAQGHEITRAGAVIVAAGMGSGALAAGLPLRPVRGQASWTDGGPPVAAAAWGGYVLPTRSGLLFGATHDREDTDTGVRETDHARNLATLRATLPELAGRIAGQSLAGRAAVRATTPDRLPIAGPAPEGDAGLFVLTGFGSRGFSLAPLLAEHVAALALGAPSPLPQALAGLVAPGRFRERAARRARS
jgi:tRNA 5-methylaminomethyl-2-thiouridine biosynthesis bifunctional protein